MRLCKDLAPTVAGCRKHGVECLHLSQRPELLYTTVISQTDRRVYVAISDDNDLAEIDEVASFPAHRIKDLPARRCIVEKKDGGEWEGVETDGIGRVRPHLSGDDGIVDSHLPI